MTMLTHRNDPVRLFFRRLGMLALLALLLFTVLGMWNAYQKERESRELRTVAEMRLRSLAAEEAQLRTKIDELETTRGKEAALREQYGVGMEGERLIVIVEPKVPEPVEVESRFRQWMRKFLPFW